MSYTPGPLPKPRGWIIDGQADGIGFRETAPEGILALVVSSAPVYTDHQLVAHTAAEVARAVAAERERWEGQHGRDSAELRRLCAERDGLRKEVQALRKLDKKRALFQAGRDSYETAAVAMNTDDEAWESFLESNGITDPQRLQGTGE